MNYSSEDYLLKLSTNFQSLEVVEQSSNSVITTYSLSTPTSVGYDEGDFVVTTGGSCSGCYVATFDPDNGDQVNFPPAKMGGVTIVRLDTLKTYTYDLAYSPVLLLIEDGVFTAKCPADSSGTEPDPNCLVITTQSI